MIAVALGSNLGDRANNLRQALRKLTRGAYPLLKKPRISRVYETPALLPDGAPAQWNQPYLNLVVSGETDLNPMTLHHRLKELEKELGREERSKWAPREMDLDLVFYDTLAMKTATLTLPHSELMHRDFVLKPLLEVAPDWFLPFHLSAETLTLKEWSERHPEFFTLQPSSKWEAMVLDPQIVGILNITPDSFSDGGANLDPTYALERAFEFVSKGAQVLDLGAESTRPGATPLTAEEEWQRLEHPLRLIRSELPLIRLSVDTRHPETAERALALGVDWINDVSACDHPDMGRLLATSPAQIVLMHHLGIPAVREKYLPKDQDPVAAVLSFLKARVEKLQDQWGIASDRIILDPGIGFGKTPEQSFEILRRMKEWQVLDSEILVGHSRKSFLGLLSSKPAHLRDPMTIATSLELARQPVDYLRVHDVQGHQEALLLHRSFQYGLPINYTPT